MDDTVAEGRGRVIVIIKYRPSVENKFSLLCRSGRTDVFSPGGSNVGADA